jgi:hypothetical protein
MDRLGVDAGVVRALSRSGRVRGKLGFETGTLSGETLYNLPYLGLDSVVAQGATWRLAGEFKAGRVFFPDFQYLEADYSSVAASFSKTTSARTVVSFIGNAERSHAEEDPYSYYGWEAGPALETFWPASTYVLGTRFSLGARRYHAIDPLFGEQRNDSKVKVEASVGNKRWRIRNSYVTLVASLERNRSNISFFDYQKNNLSVVVE